MVFRGERRGVSLCQSIKEDYTKFTPKYLPMKEMGRGGEGIRIMQNYWGGIR